MIHEKDPDHLMKRAHRIKLNQRKMKKCVSYNSQFRYIYMYFTLTLTLNDTHTHTFSLCLSLSAMKAGEGLSGEERETSDGEHGTTGQS